MAMLGRRFLNIVAAGKYKPGTLSVHRLDVSKHLFYPSTHEAQSVGGDDGEALRPPTIETLKKLPAPCAIFSDKTTAAARTSSTAFLSLLSPRSEGSRILFINEAGDSTMYYADEDCPSGRTQAIPRLEDFAGPVAASVSVVAQDVGGAAAVKEDSLYVMHGVREGVAPRFDVLRFGTPPTDDRRGGSTRVVGEGWYWQSLPSPPFVSNDDEPDRVISSYTVVDGGRTICVSSYDWPGGSRGGTWCFDTVRGEWWHASDWGMPFAGRAEDLADLGLCLGLTLSSVHGRRYGEGELSTTSGLSPSSAISKHQPADFFYILDKKRVYLPATVLQRLYKPPEQWMMAAKALQVELINLGSGRFAIAKVFNLNDGCTSDQKLVVTGVEIRPRQPLSDGLELIPHKSISYTCDSHRIHQVL